MEQPASVLDTSDDVKAILAIDPNEPRLEETKSIGFYNRYDIALMLQADALARKQQRWELVCSQEIIDLGSKLLDSPTGVGFNENEMLVVQGSAIRPLRSPFVPFRKQFIFVDTILNAFPGKIVVAGGSVFKAFIGRHHRVNRQLFNNDHLRELLQGCDVDFFFVGCTKEEVEEIIRFAWDLVHDEKATQRIMEGIDPDHAEMRYHSCIDRSQNTTTIYYSPDDMRVDWIAEYGPSGDGGKMQFIHRIYPNKESVIGGFDLGPCMALYDGTEFWATPFGAWSIATQTIILDVSRRSTSFEYRISKYVAHANCRLVIVNGSTPEIYKTLAEDPTLSRKTGRPFFPVKGLKLLTYHTPSGLYEGLDERLAAAKEKAKLEGRDLEAEYARQPVFCLAEMLAQGAHRFAADQAALNGEIDAFADEESGEDVGSEEDDEQIAPGFLPAFAGLAPVMGNLPPGLMLGAFPQMGGLQAVAPHLPVPQLGAAQEQTDEDEEDNGKINEGPDDAYLEDVNLARRREEDKRREEHNRNRFECQYSERNRMSDYDGGQFNAFNVAEANAVFAAKGKLDCIAWRAMTTEDAFEHPRIRFNLHPKMEIAEDTEPEDLPEEMYMDALRRWFPEEQVQRIIDGPMRPPQIVSVHPHILLDCIRELIKKIEQNVERAQDLADHGITIITENPGRQWTASNNPVVGNVREYYHPLVLAGRRPLIIGIPDRAFCLLVFARTRDEAGCLMTWRRLSRDVFGLIMSTVLRLLAADGNALLLGQRS